MVILVVLAILWAPYLVTLLVLRAQAARPSTPPCPFPEWVEAVSPDSGQAEAGPGWGALDDRQLTRLLIDSAGRTITE